MAHFQFSDYYIGRSTGGSATQTAAQLASDVIVDRRYGERFDYTDRRLPLHRQLVVPARAPTWAALRQELWNGAEAAETRVNAIAADVTIRGPGPHQDPRYHSATLLMTTRRLDERGFHEKAREWQDRTSGTIPHWRARWAELQNEALAAAGIDARVDHRRAAEQTLRVGAATAMPLTTDSKADARTQAQVVWLQDRRLGGQGVDPSPHIEAATPKSPPDWALE